MDQINTAIEENWLDFLDLLKQVMQVPSVKSEAGPGAPFGYRSTLGSFFGHGQKCRIWVPNKSNR